MSRTTEALDHETWDELAVRVYGPGQERRMGLLTAANPTLAAVAILTGGTLVVVPDLPAPPVSMVLPPWKR